MEGEWETRQIGDLGRVVTGKTPSTAISANFGGEYPFITIPDMDGRRQISKSARTLSELGAQSIRTCRLPAGAVMMSCIATIGKCGITTRPSFTNQQINSLICGDEADPQFVYYCFTQLGHALEAVGGGGSVYTNVSKSRFEGIELTLPPLPTQRAIAHVLGTLDDLIELNRDTNEILEEMARALFKSWFVDFDPVRAKLEGRPPAGMDAATAALFPDHFQDSELGQIPKGWEVRPLPEVIEVNPRRILKSGVIAPYLDMKNLPTRGHSADEVVDRVFTSGTKFQNGDTLLARITPCLENGKTGYVDFLADGQVGWGSTEYIVLSPKPPLPPQYGYLLARSDALRTHAIKNMTGTSGRQRVPSECFNTFLLAIPSEPQLAYRFDELTSPLMAMIKANADESRDLANLRDTLLPKLLSGEISAPAAEELIAAST
jgi:type I restriction enzyme S subunit